MFIMHEDPIPQNYWFKAQTQVQVGVLTYLQLLKYSGTKYKNNMMYPFVSNYISQI
jgi:hypothetical protein